MRLIDADSVKEIICKHEKRLKQRTMIYEVELLPTINHEDLRPKGKWEWNSDDEPYCTNCNEKADLDSYEFDCRGKVRWSCSTYCPNCGAKME